MAHKIHPIYPISRLLLPEPETTSLHLDVELYRKIAMNEWKFKDDFNIEALKNEHRTKQKELEAARYLERDNFVSFLREKSGCLI